jgi:hypothetical protein
LNLEPAGSETIVHPFSWGVVPELPDVLESRATPIRLLVEPPDTVTETVICSPGLGEVVEALMPMVALLCTLWKLQSLA